MRRRTFFTTSGILAASAVFVGGSGGRPATAGATAGGGKSPVVVELFTSQGCSSCPPAEALLGVLSKRPDVIALAWHVDYWNNLGWRDPYASPDWTRRQRRYAGVLNDEVYTPAMVVNGRRMIVGSDQPAVSGALAAAAALSVETELLRAPNGLIARVGARPAGATASLVVCDAGHATAVGGGENAGRTLQEVRIVRSLTALALPTLAHGHGDNTVGGDAVVYLPRPGPGQAAVLLVQDETYAILGAAEVRAG